MRFVHGARTDVGRGRSANEDAYLVDPAGGLYAVADGVGGHQAGEVASSIAIETLRAAFAAGASLDAAVQEANTAVFANAIENTAMRGMGTTLTAVVLTDGHLATLGHVGDSRAYLLRDGGITQVTDDHSLVGQLVREGRLSSEEAVNHPQRSVIMRAVGLDAEVEVDVYKIDLRLGDRLVLCSDGLSDMLRDDAIAAVLRRDADPQGAADALVEQANEAGGNDNITVVIVDAIGDATAEGSAALEPVRHADEPTRKWETVADGTSVEAASELEPPPAPEPAGRAGRRRATRILTWALPVLLLVGGGLAVVGWYARRTFYVGLAGEQVALYKGVPGGTLGWDPTVEERSGLRAEDLTAAERADLEAGHRFSDRSDAEAFLDGLEARHGAAATGSNDEPADADNEPVGGGSPATSPPTGPGTTTTGPLQPR
jgi:PPM family protein phosphatase